MKEIMKHLPGDITIALFSATISEEVIQISKNLLINPIQILVKNEALTLEGIKQYYIPIDKEEWKLEVLLEMYSNLDIN
jgi:superfamily II DNA/RNA helicase